MYKEQLENAINKVIEEGFKQYEYCQYVKKRKAEAKTICLYGTGNFFESYIQNISDFDYVCDSNPQKWGQYFCGKKCISPEELEKLDDVVVFIMVGNYQEVKDDLDKKNIENYYFGDMFLNVYDELYDSEWFEKNREDILNTLNVFEDEWSKKVYVNVICNRIAPEYANMNFHDLEEKGEYFDTGIWELSEDECLIDAGAYNGDSIRAFINATRGKYESIYGFEFDSENYNAMLMDEQIVQDERIHLYQMGISHKEQVMSIVHAGTGSYIVDCGDEKVQLNRLDNVLNDKRITLVKMDVEGAEIAGLIGAENIIKNQKPKLAISAYHKLDDMWNVPKLIKDMNPEYKLYLRHHTAVAWDTDCYAYIEE